MTNYYKLIEDSYVVYILKVDNAYRIGMTNKLQYRLRNLQTASLKPYTVHRLFHFSNRQKAVKFEQQLHDVLRKANKHIHGSFYSSLSIDYESN